MKFGVRKPSIKRSISARTTGKIKRSIKKTVNPLYGKKGMGYINNPKKAVYNKVYNKTTVSVKDVIGLSGGKNPAKKPKGCFSISLPFILIVLGLFTLPVGLIFMSVGFFLWAIQCIQYRASKASQDAQQETPTTSSYSPSQPDPEPEPEPEPTVEVPKKKTQTHRVAGVSFREAILKDLMGENSYYTCSKTDLISYGCVDERIYKFNVYNGSAELVPEPDNPHDPKAVKVLVEGMHIGYIKEGSCSRIHNLMRDDRIEKIKVEIKGGDYKVIYEEYDDYTDKSTYSLDKDSAPFSAVLTITLKD